jgi:predicted nucleic acid-binding protein
MVRALFDTNILVDYLRGIAAAAEELARHRERAISVVTWMEVMVGTTPATEQATRHFLAGFRTVPLDAAVAEQAVALRRTHRVKLPDAIVWASAQVHAMLLVTRNTRDFPPGDPSVRVPYEVVAPP